MHTNWNLNNLVLLTYPKQPLVFEKCAYGNGPQIGSSGCHAPALWSVVGDQWTLPPVVWQHTATCAA